MHLVLLCVTCLTAPHVYLIVCLNILLSSMVIKRCLYAEHNACIQYVSCVEMRNIDLAGCLCAGRCMYVQAFGLCFLALQLLHTQIDLHNQKKRK